MTGHDGGASPTAQRGSPVGPGESVVANYTEAVLPAEARRSNFRMFLTFGSMQLVFGAVLAGYSARFRGLPLSRIPRWRGQFTVVGPGLSAAGPPYD